MSHRSASATGGWGSPDAAIDTPQRSPVMFTVCPKCALTLVVSAEDLRVAQGYVRCGRCSSVFNALARLTEEGQIAAESFETEAPAPAASPTPPPAPPDASPQSVTDEDAIPEDALEYAPTTTDVASVFVEPPPNPLWTAATGTFKAMVAANQEAAPAQQPDSRSEEAAPAQDSDSQVDVELDAELLASILHIDLPEPPAPRETPPPAARQAPPPAPRETPPPAARQAAPPAPRETPPPAARQAAPPAPRETPPPAAAQEAPRPAARGTPPPGPAPEAPVSARSVASQARAPRRMRRGEARSAAPAPAGAAGHSAGSLRQPDRGARRGTAHVPAARHARVGFSIRGPAHRRGDGVRGSGRQCRRIRDRRLSARQRRRGHLRQRRHRALGHAVGCHLRIGPYLLPSAVVLAPMAGVTDRPF